MEMIIFYFLIFCIGTVFGSFFTLAVYRIPLHKDITHERSFCPNCNHKLSFWDMIPILSYLFLKGKCRYCGQKIRIRYLLLEVCSGIVFLLFAISLNLKLSQIDRWFYLAFGLLYMAGLFIIAGIDKEKHLVSKPVVLYEIVIISMHMLYLCILEQMNIYRYVIYLTFILICNILEIFYYKKHLKSNYLLETLSLLLIMAVFTYEIGAILTVIFMLFAIAFATLLQKLKRVMIKYKKENRNILKDFPIAFYLCIGNIIAMLVMNFYTCGWYQ